ncbi:MAG: anti-sigma factor [Acidobacteria bacterium]|nr:anti-sigma factor [Acidobacteriota bacterium]
MECLTFRESLIAYLDDEVTEKESELIEGHLHCCSSCAAELQSLSVSYRMLNDALETIDVSPEMWPRIEAAIRRRAEVPGSGWRSSPALWLPPPLRPWAASLIAVALLAVSAWLLSPALQKPDPQLEELRQQLSTMVEEMDQQDTLRHSMPPPSDQDEYDSNPFAPQHVVYNPFHASGTETRSLFAGAEGRGGTTDFRVDESEAKETR